MAYKPKLSAPSEGGTGANNTATAGKVLVGDGTNFVPSTPTFPNASATSGKFIRSDGTNWVASTPTLPTSAGTSGKVLQSNGTNYVESTPTYPSASGTSRKILVSDGTNNVYSTETYATPGTSGNVMTSDGTNWTSATPTPIYQVATGTITSAQVKALHATPIQIVAAPGSGKIIVILKMSMKLNYGGSNVFVAGASQTIDAYFGTAVSAGTNLANGGIVAAASQIQLNSANLSAAAYASCANTALNYYNSSATEISGNAANDNTLTYHVVYYIVTI